MKHLCFIGISKFSMQSIVKYFRIAFVFFLVRSEDYVFPFLRKLSKDSLKIFISDWF